MDKLNLRRFVRNIYAFSFLDMAMFLMPVYAVFMQSHGVSDIELSWMLILYPIAAMMVQMPATGIINRIGRRPAIILGQTLKAIAFFLWWAMPTHLGFAVGMFLWGVQSAFSYIAFDALLYDELAARGAAGAYTRVLGRKNAAASIGTAVSALGSGLMVFGYGCITAVSLVTLGLSMLTIMGMRLVQKTDELTPQKSNLRGLVRVGVRVCRTVPCVMPLMLLSLLMANFIYLEDYLGPIGLSLGLPVEYIGILPLFLLGCGVVGGAIAHKFNTARAWHIYAAIFATGALFVAFSWFYSIAYLVILGLAYLIGNVLKTLLYSRFQDSIPTQLRCILLSFYNLGSNLSNIIVCLTIGLGGSLGSWRYGILILGLLIIWVAVWGAIFVGANCQTPTTCTPASSPRVREIQRKSKRMGCGSCGIMGRGALQ